jgi:hypothetical protein
MEEAYEHSALERIPNGGKWIDSIVYALFYRARLCFITYAFFRQFSHVFLAQVLFSPGERRLIFMQALLFSEPFQLFDEYSFTFSHPGTSRRFLKIYCFAY